MAKTAKIPLRSEVPVEHTWDLSPLFKDDKAWERAFKKLEGQVPDLEKFRGRLGESARTLYKFLELQTAFEKDAERLRSYAFLRASEDVGNSHYQGLIQRYTHMATRANEATSFVAPEIQAIPKKKMDAFLKDKVLADYRLVLERLLRYKPHILSEKEERILAMQGEVAGTAGKIFSQLTDADLKFGYVVDERGRKVELTQGSFRSLLESPKRSVRKEAFHKFYAEIRDHEHTLAAAMSQNVLHDVYSARVRNYPSSLEAALFHDNVPVSVYDNLIETVHNHLDKVYHYFEVRRKALRLRDIRSYDTYVPLLKEGRRVTPYEEAVKLVVESLAPLGDEYCRALHRGLSRDRWVDRYENKGKRSGAFSAGGYTGPPYILMNYKDDVIDHVFTLAHEAGHSMHTYFSVRNQPFQYYDYPIFVAEVASTFNEQLLSRHMLEQSKSKEWRAFLISREIDEIRGTIVRQTMFAEYEKITHAIAEAGEPLTLERLREEYRKLLELYFGPGFTIDEELSLEGLRIPHFYYGFYVYKYATGLSAAIALSRRVLEGGEKERRDYLNFLSGGASKFPLDLLRDAGVDMTRPKPVDTAMAHLKDLVDRLEELV